MTMNLNFDNEIRYGRYNIQPRSTSSRQSAGPPIPTVKIIVVVTVIVGIIIFAMIFYLMVSFNRRQKRKNEARRQASRRRMQLSSERDAGSRSNTSMWRDKVPGSSRSESHRQSRGPQSKTNADFTLDSNKSQPKMPQKPPRLSLGSSVRRSRNEKLLDFSPRLGGLINMVPSLKNVLEGRLPAEQQIHSSSSSLPRTSIPTISSSPASSKLYISTQSPSLNFSHNTTSSNNEGSMLSPESPPFSPVLQPCIDSPTYISRSNSKNRAQSSGSIIIALDHPPVIDVPHPIISWNSSVFGKYTMKETPDPPKSALLKPNSQFSDVAHTPSLAPPRHSYRQSSSSTPLRNSSNRSLSSARGAIPHTISPSRSPTYASTNRFSASTWETSLTEADAYSIRDSMVGGGILPAPSIRPSFIDYQRVSILPFETNEDEELGDTVPKMPMARSPTTETKNTLTSITTLLRLYSNAGRNGNGSSSLLPQNSTPELTSHRQTVHKFGRQSRATTPVQQTEFVLPLFSSKKQEL